jgi:hypothetical protein
LLPNVPSSRLAEKARQQCEQHFLTLAAITRSSKSQINAITTQTVSPRSPEHNCKRSPRVMIAIRGYSSRSICQCLPLHWVCQRWGICPRACLSCLSLLSGCIFVYGDQVLS